MNVLIIKLNINGLKQSPCKTPFCICTKSVRNSSVNMEVLKQQYKFLTISRMFSGTWWYSKTQSIKLWCTSPNALAKSNNVTAKER